MKIFNIIIVCFLTIFIPGCGKNKLHKEIAELELKFKNAANNEMKNNEGNLLIEKYQEYYDNYPGDTTYMIKYAILS